MYKQVLVLVVVLLYVSAGLALNQDIHLENINVSYASSNLKYNPEEKWTQILGFRHAATGVDGHTEDNNPSIIESEKIRAQNFGRIIKNSVDDEQPILFCSDNTARCRDTLNSIMSVFDSSQCKNIQNAYNEEIKIGLDQYNFCFINKRPGYLNDTIKQFSHLFLEDNVNTHSEEHNTLRDECFQRINSALGRLRGCSYGSSTIILQAFLNMILDENMPNEAPKIYGTPANKLSPQEQIHSRLNSIINACNAGDKTVIYVHHSMFISTLLFVAEAGKRLGAKNIQDVYAKISTSIFENPEKMPEFLDLFVSCFTKYHIKNLDLIYLLYKQEDNMHSFYLCELDYIKQNQLPFYEILGPKTHTPMLCKLVSIGHLLWCDRLNGLHFMLEKDHLNKKNLLISVRDQEAEQVEDNKSLDVSNQVITRNNQTLVNTFVKNHHTPLYRCLLYIINFCSACYDKFFR